MSGLSSLPTPSALVDADRLANNLVRMQSHVDSLGVRLRPHVKTTKCVEIAALQRAAGGRGITVSTLKEAEVFFDAGFTDILYAVSIAPQKVAPALALLRRGCALQLVVDSPAGARAVVDAAAGRRLQPQVLIEVDVDGHRSGVPPGSPRLIETARVLHEGAAVLHGVMAHAGSSYDCRGGEALRALADQERTRSVEAAVRLRDAGLPCAEVSVGSTPTALAAERLDGVTEVRAGVYAFFDLVMAGVGVCTPREIALSVLTTVIGHVPERGQMVVDAGWMALSRDRGTASQPLDQRYGLVCDEAGDVIEGLLVLAANQEHGIAGWREGTAGGDLEARFPLGTRLRVLPNHACATAAQHERYHVVRGTAVEADWPRFSGW